MKKNAILVFTLFVCFSTTLVTVSAENKPFNIPLVDNQLRNLPDPIAGKPRINRAEYTAWPVNHGDAHVTLWNDDKIAALSLCVDDNWDNEHQMWLDLQKNYGVTCTWFVMTRRTGKPVKWSSFQNLLNNGNDVQSHTTNHLDLTINANRYPGIFDDQYAPSVTDINTNLVGGRCLSIGYPYGYGDIPTARKYHICARGALGLIEKADNINYMNTCSGAYNDTNRVEALIDPKFKVYNVSYYGDFLVGSYHDIGIILPATKLFLAYVSKRKDKIWVDWFTRVCQYGQERDSHTLTMNEVNNSQISFTLTDLMVDSLFDIPLTVKVRINNDWKNVGSTQNGKVIDSKLITFNGNQYLLVKAIPDRGLVEIVNELNSAVSNTSDGSIVLRQQNDELSISGVAQGKLIKVYNIKGEMLYSIIANKEKTNIRLKKGQVYIVKIDHLSYKVRMESQN